jgi:DivIVA domain-containing protein
MTDAELTPQSIRDVRFRQALRGYNAEDVDAFIARVGAAVDALTRAAQEAVARAAAAEARADEASGAEETLRKTLVLAQRTADLAVREAQDEAARLVGEAHTERDAVLTEASELRERLLSEAEQAGFDERERLHTEREALQRDVDQLLTYLSQERERLRIYFSDQLRRVQEGVPGADAPPAHEAAPRQEAPPANGVSPHLDDAPEHLEAAEDEIDLSAVGEGHEDDPFLAELRRAVTDTEPLGPRNEEDEVAEPSSDEPYDIFNDADGAGRFLRRRR